jgi:hypothetical protein
MNSKQVKITALTAEELAKLLSQAGRRAISGQTVLDIAAEAGILKEDNTISLIEYTAYLAGEIAGGSD